MTVSAAKFRVPAIYRLFFLTIEPISALIGAYFAHFQPQTYLRLTHSASAPRDAIPTGTRVVLSQLANLYFLFAINEALVLRSTSDLRVWQVLLLGLLVADLGHLYSVSQLGVDVYWKIYQWSPMDCGSIGFVYVGAIMRISFLCDLGVPTSSVKRGVKR